MRPACCWAPRPAVQYGGNPAPTPSEGSWAQPQIITGLATGMPFASQFNVSLRGSACGAAGGQGAVACGGPQRLQGKRAHLAAASSTG